MSTETLERPVTTFFPRVIFNRGELLEAVEAAAAVIRTRSPNPVLAGVLVEVATDSVTVSGTDMEIYVSTVCRTLQVERVGSVLIPAEKLRESLKLCSDETVSLNTTEDSATVTTSNARMKFQTMDVRKYHPAPAVGENEKWLTVPTERLAESIRRVRAFAADNPTLRPYYGGMIFECKGSELSNVIMNPHCMAMDKFAVEGKEDFSEIVPHKTADRVAAMTGGDVRIAINGNRAIFESGDTRITSNLIEGQFPRFNDVVSSDFSRAITADAPELLVAVRQAAMFCNETNRGVKFSVVKAGMTIVPVNPENGSSTSSVPCKLDGEEIEFGLHSQYAIEAVRGMSEMVKVECVDWNRPSVVCVDGLTAPRTACVTQLSFVRSPKRC